MTMDAGLPLWVIYFDPSDHPGKYVVRRQIAGKGGVYADPECQVVDTLEEANKLVPKGLFWLPRHPDDEPQVVGCWF